MGGLLNRSTIQGDVKGKKEKRKRRRLQLGTSFDSDPYLTQEENENNDPHNKFIDNYESWDEKYEPQSMINTNGDPPGAPNTYSSNYSASQNGTMNHAWSSPLNANYSLYPINAYPVSSPHNMAFISNQFNQARIVESTNNQSKTPNLEERPSKKVQFNSYKQQPLRSKPLTNTQSYNELKNISPSIVTPKPVLLSRRSSLPRTASGTPKTPVEKPVYISVDFRATLAERGQTTGNKRSRRNGERKHSDGLNSPANRHRARSHTNHQQRNSAPIDSPKLNNETMPNKSLDFPRLATKSASSGKLIQSNEQRSDVKSTKSRSHRRSQPVINNETNSSKIRRHKRSNTQEELSVIPNTSFSNIPSSSSAAAARPTGTSKTSGTPLMRIPLSQSNRQQPLVLSSTTTITKVNRTQT